jgi:manganese oxidase
VCLLQDMADIRNHRHHGLVGALVVLPAGHTPHDGHGDERWSGPEARIVDSAGETVAHEKVLFLQDGLRLFVAGNPAEPVRDVVPGDDPEDSGQKGISYRTEPVHPSTQLAVREPHTPTMEVPDDATVWLRVVSAADKPRNHTFTVHGVSWPSAPRPGPGPRAGAVGGITAGSVHDLVFDVEAQGDHAYRDGVFRWSVEQGMWGILRVR